METLEYLLMKGNFYFTVKLFKKILIFQILFLAFFQLAFSDDLKVYFNSPPFSNGLDDKLVKHIDSAKKTVFAHFYQIGRKKIVDAFVRAAQRLGPSNVKLVTDNHYQEKKSYRKYYEPLKNAGITVINDAIVSKGSAQSHNKFCVVDSEMVWTGSYNITDNGTEQNNNNAVLIRSKKVAKAYETELLEMHKDHLFGKKKSNNTTHFFTLESGIPIEVYMAPTDNSASEIIKEIRDADHSIYFCMFTFSHKGIISEIEKKINSGIVSKGYIDNLFAGRSYSINKNISGESLEVKWDNTQAMVHHKFMVIDPITDSNPTVITGSFNFTASADKRNDENIVIIHDKRIANLYFKEFIKLFHGKSALPPCLGTKLKLESFSDSEISISVIDDGYDGEGVDLSELVMGDPFPFIVFPEQFSMKTGQLLVVSDKIKLKKTSGTKFLSMPLSSKGRINKSALKFWIPKPGIIDTQALLYGQ